MFAPKVKAVDSGNVHNGLQVLINVACTRMAMARMIVLNFVLSFGLSIFFFASSTTCFSKADCAVCMSSFSSAVNASGLFLSNVNICFWKIFCKKEKSGNKGDLGSRDETMKRHMAHSLEYIRNPRSSMESAMVSVYDLGEFFKSN